MCWGRVGERSTEDDLDDRLFSLKAVGLVLSNKSLLWYPKAEKYPEGGDKPCASSLTNEIERKEWEQISFVHIAGRPTLLEIAFARFVHTLS